MKQAEQTISGKRALKGENIEIVYVIESFYIASLLTKPITATIVG